MTSRPFFSTHKTPRIRVVTADLGQPHTDNTSVIDVNGEQRRGGRVQNAVATAIRPEHEEEQVARRNFAQSGQRRADAELVTIPIGNASFRLAIVRLRCHLCALELL